MGETIAGEAIPSGERRETPRLLPSSHPPILCKCPHKGRLLVMKFQNLLLPHQ